MKRMLVLIAALFLISGLIGSVAWAEGTATTPGPAAGRCTLPPGLAQMSPDQVAAAALQAGLQIFPKSSDIPIPACPTLFQCSSLPGCGVGGGACTTAVLGKCCSTGAAVLCCTNEILVTRCPCRCMFEDCPHQCDTSAQVIQTCS
jgi:hypothetical protein